MVLDDKDITGETGWVDKNVIVLRNLGEEAGTFSLFVTAEPLLLH